MERGLGSSWEWKAERTPSGPPEESAGVQKLDSFRRISQFSPTHSLSPAATTTPNLPPRTLKPPFQPHSSALPKMLQPETVVKTAPASSPSQFDLDGMKHAFFQGQLGLQEGGVPIGAALVRAGELRLPLPLVRKSADSAKWSFARKIRLGRTALKSATACSI